MVAKPEGSLVVPETVRPGAAGLRARVPEVAGMTYRWEVEGGAVTGGAAGPELVFQAGTGAFLTVRCRISNEAGDSIQLARTVKLQ